MHGIMARHKYAPRRSFAVRRRNRSFRPGGRLKKLITVQFVISAILFMIIITAGKIDIPAAVFLVDRSKYILRHDIKPESIIDSAAKLATSIRNSIARSMPPGAGQDRGGENGVLDGDMTGAAGDRAGIAVENSPGGSTGNFKENVHGNAAIVNAGPVHDKAGDNMPQEGGYNAYPGDDSGISVRTGYNVSSDTVRDDAAYENSAHDDATRDDAAYDGTARIDAGGYSATSVLSASSGDDGAGKSEMVPPVNGTLELSFGEVENNITGNVRMHAGIDICAEPGSEVKAAMDGEVVSTGISPEYGTYIELGHNNDLRTIYANCGEISADIGDNIKKGDVIARIGGKGILAGSHLHFEVWSGGNPVNPLEYISIPDR